jgi:hypothetical protein
MGGTVGIVFGTTGRSPGDGDIDDTRLVVIVDENPGRRAVAVYNVLKMGRPAGSSMALRAMVLIATFSPLDSDIPTQVSPCPPEPRRRSL